MIPYQDIIYNKKFFYVQAMAHPKCVQQANSILGFKSKNFLKNWLEKEYVFEVYGKLEPEDQTRMQVLIERLIKQYSKVVLSKEVYSNVERQFSDRYNEYQIRATFERIFYSPRVKDMLKHMGMKLSNRSLVFQEVQEECKKPRIVRQTPKKGLVG